MDDRLARAGAAPVLEDAHAAAERFLDAWPQYATLLDAARVRAHVTSRIAGSPRVEEPFPHVVVDRILPGDLYEMLAAAWPPLCAFRADKHRRKLDLVPTPAAFAGVDPRASGYTSLPSCYREIWDFVVVTVNRGIVGPLLAEVFGAEIAQRLARIRDAFERGIIGYAMAGTADWSFRANVGRFMVRGNGYVLRPHVDSLAYLVTVLQYFPESAGDESFGTALYKAERPLDFDECARDGSTRYFEEAGIAVHERRTVPFRANTLVTFPNALDAAHGVTAPANGYRRVFQYHLSLKGDDEKV